MHPEQILSWPAKTSQDLNYTTHSAQPSLATRQSVGRGTQMSYSAMPLFRRQTQACEASEWQQRGQRQHAAADLRQLRRQRSAAIGVHVGRASPHGPRAKRRGKGRAAEGAPGADLQGRWRAYRAPALMACTEQCAFLLPSAMCTC